ncbi:hypothetical protein P7C70_g3896, partial [Phenoliferia sp. Uapishka_3]
MAPAPEKKLWTARHIVYMCTYILVFCIACSELGLVSQQLHNGGDCNGGDCDYPGGNGLWKHDLGLLLFTVIWTLLVCLGHWKVNLFIGTFITFIAAVFWGTGAGVAFSVTPFKSSTCGLPASHFNAKWAPFVSQCSRIVAIEGLAWANWALLTVLFFFQLSDMLTCTVARHEFYDLPPKGEEIKEKA